MKQIQVLRTFFILMFSFTGTTQDNGLYNSSFEDYSPCVTASTPYHSKFGQVISGWINLFPNNVSTPDLFVNGYDCDFTGFTTGTTTVSLQPNNASHGCTWAGFYTNFKGGSDDKFREYLAQEVDLNSGTNYTLTFDIAKSSHASSNSLDVDVAVYGYIGGIPAGQVDFCPQTSSGNAPQLGSVAKASISTVWQSKTITFTPSTNFDYLVIGGADCGTDATGVGYVFIDNVRLTAGATVLNPVIESFANIENCSLSCLKESFTFTGNAPPSGATVQWGQSASNPEQITFSDATSASTGVNETGAFTDGVYEFTYSFTKGGETVTDKIKVNISAGDFLNNFSAGTDIDFCNGKTTAPYRQAELDAPFPNNATISSLGLDVYWSMIRSDGSEWRFPNGVNPGDGIDEGDVTGFLTGTAKPKFTFRNAMNKVKFIYHLDYTDDCGSSTSLSDTVLVTLNDVQITAESECEGEVALIHQVFSNEYRVLSNNSNLTFNWTYVSSTGNLTIQNQGVSDSLRVVGNTPGIYVVKLTVTDANTGCSWDHQTILNIANCNTNAGEDIYYCQFSSENNDNATLFHVLGVPFFTNRSVNMNASPPNTAINESFEGSYWSMIRDDGTEWVFSNPCVPFDGVDEGNVYVTTNPGTTCGNNISKQPNSSDVVFRFRNPNDTVQFIWHVLKENSSGEIDTLTDEITVYMHDIDLPTKGVDTPVIISCEDTIVIEQLVDPDFLKQTASYLNYQWDLLTQTSIPLFPQFLNQSNFSNDGSGDGHFVNSSVSDFAQLVTNTPRDYYARVRVSNSSLAGCTSYDMIRVKKVDPININAGTDVFECLGTASNQFFIPDPSITYNTTGLADTNINHFENWWGVIKDDGSEWVFTNPYVSNNGLDEGSVKYITASNSFEISQLERKIFVWHVKDYCSGTILTDTVIISFGILDQANAGADQTASCNVVSLEGNLSSASSANAGFYLWEQISGPSNSNIIADGSFAYFSTANLLSGTYSFQYTLGEAPCLTTDIMDVVINSLLPANNVGLTANKTTVCQGQPVTFTASGGDQYAFSVNNVIVQSFSPTNTFTTSSLMDMDEVSVIIIINGNPCKETLDDGLVINVLSGSTAKIDLLSSNYCQGDSIVLNSTSFESDYSWRGPNSFSSTNSNPVIYNSSMVHSGKYYLEYSSSTCSGAIDSINIEINNHKNDSVYIFLCPTDSHFVEGAYQKESGIFYDSLLTSTGCDSILKTVLNLGDTVQSFITICEGDSLLLNGSYFKNSGVFHSSFPSSLGCDSVVELNISLTPIYSFSQDLTICGGDSVLVQGNYLKTSGIYKDSLSTVFGCDSVFETNFLVLDFIKTEIDTLICFNDSLLIFDEYRKLEGVYDSTFISIQGCDSVVEINLQIEQALADFSVNNVCEYDSIQLIDNSSVTNGVLSSWKWNFGDQTEFSTSNNQTVKHLYEKDSTYHIKLVVSTLNNCLDSLVSPVEVYEQPTPFFSRSGLCESDSIYFTDLTEIKQPAVIDTWIWNFGDNTSSQALNNPTHVFNNYGTYPVSLIVISSLGCVHDTILEIEISPLPVADFEASDECLFVDPTQFSDSSSVVSGTIINRTWSYGNGSIEVGTVNPIHQYNNATTYDVLLVVETDKGCFDSIEKPVDVFSNPTAIFSVDNPTQCSPNCFVFENQSLDASKELSYFWEVESYNFDNSSQENPTVCLKNEDVFNVLNLDVQLIVTDSNGCVDTSMQLDYLTIYPKPVSQFNLSPLITDINNPKVDFENLSIGADYYEWIYDDGNYSFNFEESHLYYDSGSYTPQLIVSNNYGCFDTSYQDLRVNPNLIYYIPNTFSPNGDNINDEFFIEGFGLTLDGFEFSIFDRWGLELYRTNNFIPWDGTYKGAPVLQDVYIYKVYLKNQKGIKQEVTGHVNLIK